MIKYIVKDLKEALYYLPYGVIVGILALIICKMINDRRRKKGESLLAVPGRVSFWMYASILIIITFLSRETGSRNGIDLELFSTWGINDRNNAYVIENILLFIPYGFVTAWAFVPMRSLLCCTLFGTVTTMGIEYMQLITERGYFQIDDILTNILGTMVGYLIFACLRKLYRRIQK